jgi:hypothetical protein
VYRWAVSAVAVIGVGAFAVSFLALRDLMHAIGYSAATAWAFPAIIDTAVAVATVMLVALGDKPVRRARIATVPFATQNTAMRRLAHSRAQSAKAELKRVRSAQSAGVHGARRVGQDFASVQLGEAQAVESAQSLGAQDDADLASELIASGATTQPVETVIAVLRACRGGVSINAAAKASGINYRTAQRIVQRAERQQRELLAVG